MSILLKKAHFFVEKAKSGHNIYISKYNDEIRIIDVVIKKYINIYMNEHPYITIYECYNILTDWLSLQCGDIYYYNSNEKIYY